jgi:hypothetical protein
MPTNISGVIDGDTNLVVTLESVNSDDALSLPFPISPLLKNLQLLMNLRFSTELLEELFSIESLLFTAGE